MAKYAPIKLAFKTFESKDVDNGQSPIIFMHGMTTSKNNWGDLPEITANKTKRKVYAIDFRNHGDSDWSDIWNFDCNVDDLLHFLDNQGIRKAVLVGHSMGAVAAFKTALRAPERIEKIFVEDMTTKPLPQPMFDVIATMISIIQSAFVSIPKGISENEAKEFVIGYCNDAMPEEMKRIVRFHGENKDVVSMRRTADGRFAPRANLDVLRRVIRNASDVSSDCEGVFRGPALFVWGKLSSFRVTDDEDHIKKHFPNVEFLCVEEATHTIHVDCPEEFRRALFDFLR